LQQQQQRIAAASPGCNNNIIIISSSNTFKTAAILVLRAYAPFTEIACTRERGGVAYAEPRRRWSGVREEHMWGEARASAGGGANEISGRHGGDKVNTSRPCRQGANCSGVPSCLHMLSYLFAR
jgi:hypothetical protein